MGKGRKLLIGIRLYSEVMKIVLELASGVMFSQYVNVGSVMAFPL